MRFNLGLVLLAVSIAQAQNAQPENRKDPCESEQQKAATPAVTVFQRNYKNDLPRGRQGDMAIILCVARAWGGCPFTLPAQDAELVPLSFELKPATGLSVRYRFHGHYQPQSAGSPMNVSDSGKAVLLRIRADKKATLGPTTLKGTLTFRSAGGAISSLPLSIPITVTEHNARIERGEWPYGNQVGRHVKNVLLAPVAVPAFVLFYLACGIGKGCDI